MGRRVGLAADKLLHNSYMTVIDVGVCDHVHELARDHIVYLGNHHQQEGVLAYIPVIGCEYVLAALDEAHVERGPVIVFFVRDVVDHVVGARVEVHLGEVAKSVGRGHNTARKGRVFEVEEDFVHLVEVPFGVV